MPFPTLSSSFPGGGKPSADFGGPVLFGKIKDQGVPTGAQVFPSGTLLIQSTGTVTNQVISTGAVNRASLIYVAVSTASLIGAGAPPYTGYGAGMALIASTTPHIEVWSSGANDWIEFFASTNPGNVTGNGTTGFIPMWGTPNSLVVSGIFDDGTTLRVNSVGSTFDSLVLNTSGFDGSSLGNRNTEGTDTQAVGELINLGTASDSQAIGNRITDANGSDNQFIGENLTSTTCSNIVVVGQTLTSSALNNLSGVIVLGVDIPCITVRSSQTTFYSSATLMSTDTVFRIASSSMFATNLPTTAPTAGTKQVWNNGGVMTIA